MGFAGYAQPSSSPRLVIAKFVRCLLPLEDLCLLCDSPDRPVSVCDFLLAQMQAVQ